MAAAHSDYLYTLALLAMTFVGFTAIVMILRQNLGGALSRFDALVTRFFMVWGFLIAYGAMLPPLLAAFGLPASAIWRGCSAVIGLLLLALSLFYPLLRGKATGERAPALTFGQSAAGVAIGAIALVDATVPFDVQLASAIYLLVLTLTLAQASVGFIITLSFILTHTKPK
jgi:hypothetical protein